MRARGRVKSMEPNYKDIGPYEAPKRHVKKNRKYSKKANEKVHHVIREFEAGKLHSGSKKGPKVKNIRQAIAIGISEAKKRGYKTGSKRKGKGS